MTDQQRLTAERRLSHDEAAAYLEVHPQTLFRWRRTGQLDQVTHRTPSGAPYFFPDELDAWLRSRCSAPDGGR